MKLNRKGCLHRAQNHHPPPQVSLSYNIINMEYTDCTTLTRYNTLPSPWVTATLLIRSVSHDAAASSPPTADPSLVPDQEAGEVLLKPYLVYCNNSIQSSLGTDYETRKKEEVYSKFIYFLKQVQNLNKYKNK